MSDRIRRGGPVRGLLLTAALAIGGGGGAAAECRLALVLARAQKRPVLLLDEFGAEQDPEFRAFFYTDYLEALRAEGITVIAVTHDDRYFGTCDRLIKLDFGKLVHDGAPDTAADGLALKQVGEA